MGLIPHDATFSLYTVLRCVENRQTIVLRVALVKRS